MASDALAEVEAIFQIATERAVCVRADETSCTDVWFALSQVEVAAPTGGLARGEVVTITGPEWLLVQEGLL